MRKAFIDSIAVKKQAMELFKKYREWGVEGISLAECMAEINAPGHVMRGAHGARAGDFNAVPFKGRIQRSKISHPQAEHSKPLRKEKVPEKIIVKKTILIKNPEGKKNIRERISTGEVKNLLRGKGNKKLHVVEHREKVPGRAKANFDRAPWEKSPNWK